MADRDRDDNDNRDNKNIKDNRTQGSTGQGTQGQQGNRSGNPGGQSTQGRGNPDQSRDDKGQFEGGKPATGSKNAGRSGSQGDADTEKDDE
jgi:hypothetical protein